MEENRTIRVIIVPIEGAVSRNSRSMSKASKTWLVSAATTRFSPIRPFPRVMCARSSIIQSPALL